MWSGPHHVPDIQREQSSDQLRDCGPGFTAVTACAGQAQHPVTKLRNRHPIKYRLNLTSSWLSNFENQNKHVMFMCIRLVSPPLIVTNVTENIPESR